MASVMSLEDSVEATLREQLQQWRDQPFTIFRVPAYVRASNPTAYAPRMVSFGPYYHGDVALRAMEDHKWRYLHDLLSRNTAVSSSLLIQEMRSMEPRARACYSERPALGSDEFIRMLLLDASFILELLIKWHTGCPDRLCDAAWGRTLITSDLLLLENQIPFFVVDKLHEVIAGGGQGGRREALFYLFLRSMVHGGLEDDAIPSANSDIHHLLHLLYEGVVPKRRSSPVAGSSPFSESARRSSPAVGSSPSSESARRSSPAAGSSPTSEPKVRVIPRAAEMSAAGVTFIRRRHVKDMYDVAFHGGTGVMELPAMVIDDMTWPLIINLIAFEQIQVEEGEACMVISYVNLMSMLVRTAEDVQLLRRCGILENLMADDEAAARVFRHLGEGRAVNYKQQVFAALYHDVDRYCGSWWHRNMAALRRDYFGSPWSAISFVVAGLAVALTATQTYFTVFPSSTK